MKQRNCKNKRYIPVPSHSSRHGINFWHKMLQQQVKKANAICPKINDLEFVLLHCWKRTLALLAILVFPRFHQKVLKCNAISNSQGLRWGMERLLLRNNSWYFTEMTSLMIREIVEANVSMCSADTEEENCRRRILQRKLPAEGNSLTEDTRPTQKAAIKGAIGPPIMLVSEN